MNKKAEKKKGFIRGVLTAAAASALEKLLINLLSSPAGDEGSGGKLIRGAERSAVVWKIK